jgi:hypothetical protein
MPEEATSAPPRASGNPSPPEYAKGGRSAAEAGAEKTSRPKTLAELAAQPRPAHAEELARRFHRAPRNDVQEVLNALVAFGLARRLDDNRYAP